MCSTNFLVAWLTVETNVFFGAEVFYSKTNEGGDQSKTPMDPMGMDEPSEWSDGNETNVGMETGGYVALMMKRELVNGVDLLYSRGLVSTEKSYAARERDVEILLHSR